MKTTILPYELKDKSNIRIMAELNAREIVYRDGQFVMWISKS